MPAWLQAVILGIVQGLTEFIPVSSSAHLAIVPYLAGWEHSSLAFDVALHIGTLAAVVVYFRGELIAMVRGLLGGRSVDDRIYRRLALYVAAASVPVAIVGYFLEDIVADAAEDPRLVALLLLVTAALLTVGEWARTHRVKRAAAAVPAAAPGQPVWNGDWVGPRGGGDEDADVGSLPIGDDPTDPAGTTLEGMGLRQAMAVGVLQCLALLPGVSRSGTTITGGLFSGLTREAATRFSFLLSLPALVGAFVLSVPDLAEPGQYSGAAITAGVAASFVSGYIAVRFLVRLVARDRLTPFARYCVFLSVVTLIAYQFLGPPSSV